MRSRLLAIPAAVIMLAGCAGAVAPPSASRTAPEARPSARPGSQVVAAAPSARPAAAVRGCRAPAAVPRFPAGFLTGVQFVSAADGWAVGQDKILATTDGGRHWAVQGSGPLDLTSVDFVSSEAGWAVGTRSVLATSDGGAHWAPLPEPCPLIRSVHFVSPQVGFAVAGGRNISDVGTETPEVGGVALATGDGGRTWRILPAPANAQTICFTSPRSGWLGAGGRLYRSTDGGLRWAQVTAGVTPISAAYPYTMIVQCAGTGSAWALDIGPGAAMSQQPHAGYHAGPAGAVPVFAEQYFPHPGARVRAESPGSYAGPFSAISPSVAAFIDWCPACGPGTAPWDLVTGSGAFPARKGKVGGLTYAAAASFLSPQLGWVVGIVSHYNATGITRQDQRIVVTHDGGRTWAIQYTSPVAA